MKLFFKLVAVMAIGIAIPACAQALPQDVLDQVKVIQEKAQDALDKFDHAKKKFDADAKVVLQLERDKLADMVRKEVAHIPAESIDLLLEITQNPAYGFPHCIYYKSILSIATKIQNGDFVKKEKPKGFAAVATAPVLWFAKQTKKHPAIVTILAATGLGYGAYTIYCARNKAEQYDDAEQYA